MNQEPITSIEERFKNQLTINQKLRNENKELILKVQDLDNQNDRLRDYYQKEIDYLKKTITSILKFVNKSE